jgi:nicotinamide-nucleotide amidase
VGLDHEVGRRLKEQGLTLAVAESCTGGLIGHRITSVSGSSEYFRGGVVAYANDLKRGLLGVGAGTLRRKGAVSDAVAAAMASGVRRRCGADVGLGITGIAGPGGATPGKPVGLVYIGIADGKRSAVRRRVFGGSRARVKAAAGRAALGLLRDFLNGQEREGEKHG